MAGMLALLASTLVLVAAAWLALRRVDIRLVLGLAVPIYAGMWWAFRKFAPTHFEIAGAAAGIGAGAVAGILYSFHCPSNTAVFALTWYTISFALAGAAGAALGRRLLRW